MNETQLNAIADYCWDEDECLIDDFLAVEPLTDWERELAGLSFEAAYGFDD